MSKIRLAEGAAPETPATGKVYIYPKTDGKVYSKDDTGTEYDLTAGAGGESNTASNVGSVGTGIYKQKTGVDLELYKLNSTNNLLTIALDETDKIDFTFNQSNITEVGTITTGVWHGTEIDVAYGGTGASTLTDGGILLGSGTGAITAMSVLGDGEVVVGDGVGDPTVISAFTSSTGKLKHEVGGIEADISAIAKGGILAGTDDGAMGILPAGTDGYFLKRDDTQATGLAWASVSGLGDVLGPASSTDNAVARFNGTGGKNIQSSGVIIDDNDNITFGGNVDISSEISDWTIKNDEPAALEIKKGGASPTNMIKFTTTIGSEVMRFYYDVVLDGALKIKDDDNSHTLNIVWDEAETASNRTLKLAVAGGDRRVMFNEDFTIGDGYVVSITAEDTNTDIVMDNANFEVESTDTTQRNFKITSDKAGDVLLTIKENFTIGDGYAGTLTYSATGKTLTVEDNSNINQDLTTDASPTFDGLTLGVSDSGSNSLMTITGAGTGSPEGGEIRLEMAADYDTTYDFWRIDVNEDDLRFGAEGQTWVTFEADGTINVSGVTDYENLVTSDDDIPNKKYVDDYAIQDTADVIKDTHIDWGTGANQVSLDDVPDGNTYARLTVTQKSDLTDGGDSSLHYHSADRDLSNATGTLTISHGGTNNTSYTTGKFIAYDGTKLASTAYDNSSFASASHTHNASDITAGTLLHERGGLEADVSAYNGLVKIAGGTTSYITDNSANWDTAYTHSQTTTGNPHSISVNDLTDTNISSPGSGQLLTYDGSNWVNRTPPMTFSIANIKISAQQNLNLTRFTCPAGKKVYVLQAAACASGGSSIADLFIEILSGSTSVYKTSSSTLQIGNPLAVADGGNIKIRFAYSGGNASGIVYGTGFMNIGVW